MYNFELVKKEYLDDIGAEGFIYRHRCGAKLVYLKNDDREMSYIVGFRTQPKNDKGTPHIIEHTVLCGSEKYRVKDPFNLLDKGSIHSYLNAMTYPDKTVYPVASTNKRDFETLVRVYTDAVFKPLIYENEGIFRQEGWSSDGKSYNGIVLNEMKGAYASPARKLSRAIKKALLGGTGCEFDSGGVPEDITKLSYEEFLQFHKDYYSPNRALFMFYGDVDIEHYMELIDCEYLKNAKDEAVEYKEADIKKYSCDDVYAQANIGSKESFLEAAYVLPQCAKDYSLSVLCDIIADYLSNLEQSPLKSALFERGICSKVEVYYDDCSAVPMLSIEAQGADKEALPAFKKAVNEVWASLAKNGLDPYMQQSVINSFKFFFKAEDFGYKPRGMFYLLMLQKSVLYGIDSFEPLYINEQFEAIDGTDISSFIRESFVDKGCFGIISDGNEKNAEAEALYANNESLIAYQAQQDTPEAVAAIKQTDISAIDKTEPEFKYDADESCVLVDAPKNEIVYLDILFDTTCLTEDELSLLGVYKFVTEVFDAELSTDLSYYTGDFSIYTTTIGVKGGKFKPMLAFSINVLRENVEKAIKLLERVINCSFDDKERLKSLIDEQKQYVTDAYIKNGASKAYTHALAMTEADYSFDYNVSGYPLYKLLTGDIELDMLAEKLRDILGSVIGSDNMYYVLTCGAKDREAIVKSIESFKDNLPKGLMGCNSYNTLDNAGIAYAVTGDVSNNALSCKYTYKTGVNSVVRQIINSGYIWDKIRIEGGAYGGGCSMLRSRCFYMYSYRDPQINNSYEVFKAVGDYMANNNFNQNEVDRFIAGAINAIDRPLKIGEYNSLALRRHFMGTNMDIINKRRGELLSATASDIRKVGEYLCKSLEKVNICTVGNEKSIKNSGLFKEIVRID